MRLFFISILIQCIIFQPVFAQFDNVWIFGTNAGISFNGATPAPVTSVINSNEAAASVCDANGDLLFYTDGTTVWDRFNTPMPNGTGLQPYLNGTSSTSQGAQIVPVIDSPGKYYIFTITGENLGVINRGRFYYSIVDMSLNGGLGDVVSSRKQILVKTGMTEQMIAVPGEDCDIWLLLVSQQDSLYAFRIDRNGLHTTPVLSPVAGGMSSYFNGVIGNMEISPDRKKLAIARGSLTVYDFDFSTGLATNTVPLVNPSNNAMTFYALEFSPDNNIVYATQGGTCCGRGLHQFVVSSGAHTQIAAASVYGIKRGPDDQIYVLEYEANRVHVIRNPDVPGVGCQFDQNVLTLNPGSIGKSKFSNHYPVLPPLDTISRTVQVIPGCDVQQYPELQAAVSTGRNYVWSDGDTGRLKTITTSGTYVLTYSESCKSYIDTFHVSPLFLERLDLGPDTTICDLAYTLDATYPGAAGYLWNNGHRDPRLTLTESGSYRVSVEGFRCPLQDTIHVRFVPPVNVDLGPDTIICKQTPARIGAQIAAADSYLWSTGATIPYIEVSESGNYRMSILVSGCEFSDTLTVTAMDAPEPDLGADGKICMDQRILLNAFAGAGASYRWSNGDTQSAILVTEAGIYSVRVLSEYGCTAQDTVRFVFVPEPVIYIGPDTVVCEETPLILRANAIGADSIMWSDGTVGPVISIRHGNVFTATAYNYCGVAADTVEVKQIFCDIWVPNAFTPNGDGRNDVFRVLGNIGKLEGFGLSLYNRWGERVFHTQDKYAGWDGYHKNLPSQLGTYVYIMQYSIGGTPYQQQGNFHLLR